jgi:hypothetical protein
MKIGLMGRVTQNFAVENRFGGTAIQVGLNFLIPSTALMVKNTYQILI